MPEETMNELLTYRDAAKVLAISERSLWQVAHDGLIPQVRIGRSVRFDRADLMAFVGQQKERASAKRVLPAVAHAACPENAAKHREI
jgi:excisionase family DNA binding protein